MTHTKKPATRNVAGTDSRESELLQVVSISYQRSAINSANQRLERDNAPFVARQRIIDFYEAWDKPEEAARWRATTAE